MEKTLRITILKDAFQKLLTRVLLLKIGLLTINLYVKLDLTTSFIFQHYLWDKDPSRQTGSYLSMFIFFYPPKHKIDKKAAKSDFKRTIKSLESFANPVK